MIPVILIHKGFQRYVEYTIKQANKNNFVYLIGDTNPNLNITNFEFVPMTDYMTDCEQFSFLYKHMNTTPVDYEVFCYHRWFILKNFMIAKNLSTVFYIDSDVMLFVNVTDEFPKFEQYDLTLLHRTAAISSYMTLDGINNFCKFLMNTYYSKTNYNYKKIASHFFIRQENGLAGGVCDMTLFEFFHYHSDVGGGPGKVGEMMQIINDTTYDHNINAQDQYFEFKNGMKAFKIIDKVPYVYSNKLKKDIKFNSLHFQGGAKNLIEQVYGQCN